MQGHWVSYMRDVSVCSEEVDETTGQDYRANAGFRVGINVSAPPRKAWIPLSLILEAASLSAIAVLG